MPIIAGPWLAGTFDNDRAAARTASDALELVFPTTEKVQGVRKAFHGPILDYCRDAALHQTAQTLSDERAVSPDDAQATYARVVATSLSLLGSLIRRLQAEDQAKEYQVYDEMFSNAKLWDFANHSDAGVRRSMHRLIQTCIEHQHRLIDGNIKIGSATYIYKCLHSDQTGSALEFIQTLEALTTALPTIWTDMYTGKKPAISRLRHFLKQGSQSASTGFWECLAKIFRALPGQVLPSTLEEISSLLSAARAGVSKREERFNVSSAWPAYFTIAEVTISPLTGAEAESILTDHVMPVVRQYVNPSPETADWSILGAKTAWIVSQAAAIPKLAPLLNRAWPQFTNQLIQTARASQPEQAREFDKSQRHVAGNGERLADLQRELWGRDSASLKILESTFVTTNTTIMNECISLLKSRNGKPYGAAAVIEQLLHTSGKYLLVDEAFRVTLTAFMETDVPRLMFSPSNRHLIQTYYAIGSEAEYSQGFPGVLRGVLNASESIDSKLIVLRMIFTHNTPAEANKTAHGMPEFQSFIVESMSAKITEMNTALFSDMVRLGAVTSETTDTVLSELTAHLSTADESTASLTAIELISNTNSTAVEAFISRPDGAGQQLLPGVLHLEQSPDDRVAEKATILSKKLSSAIGEGNSDAKYSVILQNLETVSMRSLPMDAVHDLTDRLLGSEHKVQTPLDFLPPMEVWRTSLCATMNPPRSSLALLSPLGGTVHLIHSGNPKPNQQVSYDAEGFSQALRISMYLSRLLSQTDLLQHLRDLETTVLALLHVAVLVAEDNVSILGANELWRPESGQEGEAAVLDFISESHRVLGSYWKSLEPNLDDEPSAGSLDFFSALQKLQHDQESSSPLSYYLSLSSAKAYSNVFELHGFSTEQGKKSEAMLRHRRSAKQSVPLVACLAGFHQPLSGTQTLNRLCNELVAELTDVNVVENGSRALEVLILLNTILYTQEDAIAGIARQRLIFLVKRILPWLDGNTSQSIKAEVCKALAELLPGMHDMYGEHWEHALDFLTGYWTSGENDADGGSVGEDHILFENASLKLFATVRKLAKSDDPNDDLVDALKDRQNQVHNGMINLLKSANGIDDETHQPLMITHELLARQIASLPYKSIPDVDDLYPLVYASSRPIGQATFDLLHKQIPAAQEQISFNAALENKTAQLPDELLSLIIEAPTLDSLVDASFDGTMPLSLQGYLYSWRLLFDHFNGSSYRVKSDYIEQLKDGIYLSGLLNFAFDFLGHTRGKPVDVSKFDTQEYISDTERSPEKDVQWLLTHLYFLALTHLPSLVKSYYLDIRSRQTSLAIENWTAKNMSPLIIHASLQAVAEWSEKSAKEDAESDKLSVKVGMRSKEINVSYVVDEQTMAIKVVLPEAYPLASARVVGVSRVAVKEEKWQSWLRNCQGVITFSVSIFTSPNRLDNRTDVRAERQHNRRPVCLAKERCRCAQRPD